MCVCARAHDVVGGNLPEVASSSSSPSTRAAPLRTSHELKGEILVKKMHHLRDVRSVLVAQQVVADLAGLQSSHRPFLSRRAP